MCSVIVVEVAGGVAEQRLVQVDKPNQGCSHEHMLIFSVEELVR